jgi:drug/metabolite transporter (DMT)-like permease
MAAVSRSKTVATAVSLGILAAFFFSTTFVINRWLSVGGGSWYWTATLRYVFVFLILSPLLAVRFSPGLLWRCVQVFVRNIGFWVMSGGIGFGVFYLALCYAASFAPGWVVATTWQLTILAGPFISRLFGLRVTVGSFVFSGIAFLGVVLVNAHAGMQINSAILEGILFVCIAAVCYPFGNTLCGLAKAGRMAVIHHGDVELLDNTYARIWLMTAGALPILIVAGLAVGVTDLPSPDQLLGVAYVAVSTGVVATALFLYARQNVARTGDEVAAVDSTQSFEVPFALLFEVLVLGAPWPNFVGWIGVLAVVIGVSGYVVTAQVEIDVDDASKTGSLRHQ